MVGMGPSLRKLLRSKEIMPTMKVIYALEDDRFSILN